MNLTLSNIKLNRHLLTLAKSVMYLGTEIDENVTWNNRIEVLSKLRYFIPTENLTSIYYILFQSYIL